MTKTEATQIANSIIEACDHADIRGGKFVLIHSDGTRTERTFGRDLSDKDFRWKVTMAGLSDTYSLSAFNDEFPLKST